MQPLTATRKNNHPQTRIKRDPAPSRVAYRFHRLWLTPVFRALIRVGVPGLGVFILAFWYLTDESRIEQIQLSISELRSSVEQRPEFMVKLMRIENVSSEVAEDIREVTVVDFPISSFDLDLDVMRGQIEELDAIAKADLIIRPGGVLDVEVIERLPAIIWRGRRQLELLDDEGRRVAPLAARANRVDLPLVAGDGADRKVPEALAILEALGPISGRLRGLTYIGERRWDVVLDRGQRIFLPEVDPIQALERVIALHGATNLMGRDFVILDMRDGRRPILRLTNNAMDAIRGIEQPTDGDDA